MIEEKKTFEPSIKKRRLSKSQVIIETNNKNETEILTSPKGFENDEIIETIIYYFTTPSYTSSIGKSTKSNRNYVVKKFFNFIDSNYKDKTIKKLPSNCFSDWFEYLKNNERTAKTVWSNMSIMHRIYSRSLLKKYGNATKWPKTQKDSYFDLKNKIPRKPAEEKIQPIGDRLGIPASDFSNKELFMGIRYGCLWMLEKINHIRDLFLEEKEIKNAILKVEGKNLKEIDVYFLTKNNMRQSQRYKKPHLSSIANSTWKIIQGNPLIAEWQCYCFKGLRSALDYENEPLTKVNQDSFLSRYINKSGELTSSPKGYGKGDTSWLFLNKYLGSPNSTKSLLPRMCMWGAEWLIHNELENLLMVWLLATERIQKSGIERLLTSDLSINKKNLQITHLKIRRKPRRSNDLDILVHSPIYRHYEPPYKAYKNWVNRINESKKIISDLNPKNHFIYKSKSRLTGQILSNTSASLSNCFLPLQLITREGTIWNKLFLDDAKGSPESKAFIRIIKTLLDDKELNPKKDISLSTSTIGQSLIIEKEIENNHSKKHTKIESTTLGHSESTGRNIYKDRFRTTNTSEIIEPIKDFARRVGDEKFKIAIEISRNLKNKTKTLSLSELEKICGVTSSNTTQKDLLDKLDEQDKLDITGEIKINGELIIIQSEFVSAMMWGYIKHIEKEIIALSSSPRETRTINLIAKYIHLNNIFDTFYPDIKKSGKELSEKMRFPYPPLN